MIITQLTIRQQNDITPTRPILVFLTARPHEELEAMDGIEELKTEIRESTDLDLTSYNLRLVGVLRSPF